jgi:hypothetical protein
MSPVHDPRFSKAAWDKSRAAEQEESRRGGRAEYVKALAVLAAALPASFLLMRREFPGGIAAAAGGYLLWLALSVGAAAGGLLISAKLFLGDAGPLLLSIVRIAAAVTTASAVYALLGGGRAPGITAGLAGIGVYALATTWLFDMDLQDAALCGAITLGLVVAVSIVLATAVPGA